MFLRSDVDGFFRLAQKQLRAHYLAAMTFLPVVQYELRAAARRRSTFIARLLCSGIAFLGGVFYILLDPMNGTTTVLGAAAFRTMSFFAVALCCLIPVILAHDSISEERRMGTLGLLLLTDLKGYDIVIGKLLGISLNAFYCLLGVLPALALPLLFGGIEVGEFWRMCLALTNLMFFCFAVTVSVSAFFKSSRAAFAMSALAAFIFCVVLPALNVSTVFAGPIKVISYAFESQYLLNASTFWSGLFSSIVTAILFLSLASRNLPRTLSREKARARNKVQQVKKLRDRVLLQTDPVQWLLLDSSLWSASVRLFTIALVVALILGALLPATHPLSGLVGWPILGTLVIFKLLVAQQSSRFFTEGRRTGALEAICSTPLTTSEIIHGQWRALRNVFLVPASLLLIFYFIALQTHAFEPILMLQARTSIVGFNPPLLAIYLVVLFAFDLVAIGWFGMWMAYSLAKPQFAVIFTMLLAVVVPAVVIIFPHPLITLTLLVVGRSRLRQHFRTGDHVPGQTR